MRQAPGGDAQARIRAGDPARGGGGCRGERVRGRNRHLTEQRRGARLSCARSSSQTGQGFVRYLRGARLPGMLLRQRPHSPLNEQGGRVIPSVGIPGRGGRPPAQKITAEIAEYAEMISAVSAVSAVKSPDLLPRRSAEGR